MIRLAFALAAALLMGTAFFALRRFLVRFIVRSVARDEAAPLPANWPEIVTRNVPAVRHLDPCQLDRLLRISRKLLGGVNVELSGDVRFRVVALTDRDADEMLKETRGARLLQGFRGQLPADIGALREVLLRLSSLADQVPDIAEMDLNPVIALPPGKGCYAVDARVRIRAAANQT